MSVNSSGQWPGLFNGYFARGEGEKTGFEFGPCGVERAFVYFFTAFHKLLLLGIRVHWPGVDEGFIWLGWRENSWVFEGLMK